MLENLFQLTLGEYKVQIDEDKLFNIKIINNSSAIVTVEGNPNLKATISVEQVPRGLDRNGIWRDSFNRDISGILHKMTNVDTTDMASMSLPRPNIVVNGHQGFDLFITNGGLSAYRIGYWLDDDADDAISIFASFPKESSVKDDIVALANSLHVIKS
jgi:hypothetical protein